MRREKQISRFYQIYGLHRDLTVLLRVKFDFTHPVQNRKSTLMLE